MNSTEEPSTVDLVEIPLWFRVTTAIYLVVVHAVGVPSNIITAIIYARMSPRTACDWLILTMSVTDAVVCFSSPALYLRSFLNIPLAWTPPGILCSLEYWLQMTAMLASCFLLVVIALDRYVKICLPDKTSLTPPKARNVCVICVTIAATAAFVPFLLRMENANCYIWEVKYTKATRAYFSSLFCFFVISFFIVTFAYVSICKQIDEKIKRKQRLLLDNGLTEPTMCNPEETDSCWPQQNLILCFKCPINSRKASCNSSVSNNHETVCCFKTKCFKDEEQQCKYTVTVDNYGNNGKINPLVPESVQSKQFIEDVDKTTDYKQENSNVDFKTNKPEIGSCNSRNAKKNFESLNPLNKSQNNDSEMGALLGEDLTEVEDKNFKDNTKQTTIVKDNTFKDNTTDSSYCKKQQGNDRNITNIRNNIIYSVSNHATDCKDSCSESTSSQRNTTDLKALSKTSSSITNSVFLDGENEPSKSHRQEQEVGKNYVQISSSSKKPPHCVRGCIRKDCVGDDQIDCGLPQNHEIGTTRNVIFTSREFDKVKTSLYVKADTPFLRAGSLGIQKAVSCPEMLAAGDKHGYCCCSKCEVVCNKPFISNTMTDAPVSASVKLSKTKFTKSKCSSLANQLVAAPLLCTPTSDNSREQPRVDLYARHSRHLGNGVFNTNLNSLLARSEPCLLGNTIGLHHSVWSESCCDINVLPMTVSSIPAVDVTNTCDTPQSYIQLCSFRLKEGNSSRSVSFSDIVKEIPHELSSPDNQLSVLVSATVGDTPTDQESRIRLLDNTLTEMDLTDKNSKDKDTLISPSLFPPDPGSLYAQEFSQWETGDYGADMPREAIFSRGLKRRKFKNSKESVMSTESRKRFARERQMTRMLYSVTAAFLLSWIPTWAIYLLCLHASLEYSRTSVYTFLTTIHLFNYLASPVIYYTFNPTFRSRVNALMTSLISKLCCFRRARTSNEKM